MKKLSLEYLVETFYPQYKNMSSVGGLDVMLGNTKSSSLEPTYSL